MDESRHRAGAQFNGEIEYQHRCDRDFMNNSSKMYADFRHGIPVPSSADTPHSPAAETGPTAKMYNS